MQTKGKVNTHTTEAHCKIDPMTQTRPERTMVGLRPIRSANCVTSNAPTKEPAGMDATMAPWASLLGWESLTKQEIKRFNNSFLPCGTCSGRPRSNWCQGTWNSEPNLTNSSHSKRQTWRKYQDQRGLLQCKQRSPPHTTTKMRMGDYSSKIRTGLDAIAALYWYRSQYL